jgi:DNA-binding NtrC family response regulator
VGGVLFLDEVADLDLETQAIALRAIDQVHPRIAGKPDAAAAQVRVIAATSRDLPQACRNGLFRQDLLYRLSGITIRVPPLRTRRTEILALAQSIIASHQGQLELSLPAAEALLLATWEGNVRQLENVVLQASVRALEAHSKRILPEHLPELRSPSAAGGLRCSALTCSELVNALADSQGNASAAAKTLGVSRATLYNLFKRHGVDPRTARGRVV